jgi:hypothetical protein
VAASYLGAAPENATLAIEATQCEGLSTEGMAASAGLAIGPCMRAAMVHASLLGSVGFVLRTPEALVARSSTEVDGAKTYDLEDPVSLGGMWAGASLRLGLEVGRR